MKYRVIQWTTGNVGSRALRAIIESGDRRAMGKFIGNLPPDERVDILEDVAPEVVEELLPLVPSTERRDILRLQAYPEGTAGALSL